jgi:hypothetical protein
MIESNRFDLNQIGRLFGKFKGLVVADGEP